MKKIAILLLTILNCQYSLFAQQKIATQEDVSRLFLSTTYVVLTNDNMILDAMARQIIPKIWKITPYKLIDVAEFERLRINPDNSFLLFSRVEFSKDANKNPYIFLSLLLGDKKATNTLDPMPEIAFIPFDCETSSGDVSYSILEPLLQFTQEHTQRMVKKDFRDFFGMDRHRKLGAYNRNNKLLANKTILINKDNIDATYFAENKDLIESKSGNRIKIVSLDEIDKALTEKTPNVVVAHSVFPESSSGKGAYTYNYILGVDDNIMYYYEYHKANKYRGFCKADFNTLFKLLK